MAIDVFYLTRDRLKIQSSRQQFLQQSLLDAIAANAR
jgi:hypothetical protein